MCLQRLQIGGMVYAFDLKSNFIYFSRLVIWRGGRVRFIAPVLKTGGCNSPLGSNPSPSATKTRTAIVLLNRGSAHSIGRKLVSLSKLNIPIRFIIIAESNGVINLGSTCRYSPRVLNICGRHSSAE